MAEMDKLKDRSSLSEHNHLELEILIKEYFFIQATIEDYNRQIWIIKSLGISGTGAVIWLTLQQHESIFALLGCSIPMFFWTLESQWKHFQRGFYPRVREIEDTLKKSYNLQTPAIMSSWSETFRRPTKARRHGYVWDGFLNPSVCASYVLQTFFLIVVYFVSSDIF